MVTSATRAHRHQQQEPPTSATRSINVSHPEHIDISNKNTATSPPRTRRHPQQEHNEEHRHQQQEHISNKNASTPPHKNTSTSASTSAARRQPKPSATRTHRHQQHIIKTRTRSRLPSTSTTSRSRASVVDDFCTNREHKGHWLVLYPQAAATISLLQANIKKPMVRDMLEENKCLQAA